MEQLSAKDKIYIAGHRGLAGSAIERKLKSKGYENFVYRTRTELDLRDAQKVEEFYKKEKPDCVIIAAAMVGGIHANNTYRADFIFDNLCIQNNLIWGAHKTDVKKLVFLGSSCIYPRNAEQPMKESCLLTGPLEYTNRPYALAKISGLELISCLRTQYKRDYFSVMPTNLYGVNDNFHLENSHVLPAMIRKFWQAKKDNAEKVVIWGSGSPKREFMFSDDFADALVYLLENVSFEKLEKSDPSNQGWTHINVGSGHEISIAEVAKKISKIIGFQGEIVQDTSKPDGTPRKLLDCALLQNLGWSSQRSLDDGLEKTIQWFNEIMEMGEKERQIYVRL